MIPETAKEIITSGVYAHLATIDPDGKPHVTMAWTGISDDEIVIATLFPQRKLTNIQRDPRVTLSWETDRINEWGLREYLVVYGRARVTEGGAPELLQELAHTYIGPSVKFPQMDAPPPGYVTRIAPTKIAGVGPWAQ